MSSHEIIKAAAQLERLGVALPDDAEFWESIESESDGRHALVVGDLDDAIVITGSVADLERVAALVSLRVAEVKARVYADTYPSPPTEAEVTADSDADTGEWVRQWVRPGQRMPESGHVLGDGQHGILLDSGVELVATGEQFGKLGDALAARFVSPRTMAVDDAASGLSGIYPGEGIGFGAFNCGELNPLVKMLALHGHFDTAAAAIRSHAVEDDCGDRHGYLAAMVDDGDGVEASEVYVRRLLGDTDAMPSNAGELTDELDRLVEQQADGDRSKATWERVRQIRQELGEDVDLDAEWLGDHLCDDECGDPGHPRDGRVTEFS